MLLNKNPFNLIISNRKFEVTNFITHDFDWGNPLFVSGAVIKYTDYKCKNCGTDLMESYFGSAPGDKSNYVLNTSDDELKTCNELLMREVIK